MPVHKYLRYPLLVGSREELVLSVWEKIDAPPEGVNFWQPYHFNLRSESSDKSGSLATKTIVKVGFTVTSILRHSLNDIENRSVPHFIRLPKSGFTGVCLFVFYLFIFCGVNKRKQRTTNTNNAIMSSFNHWILLKYFLRIITSQC